MGYRSDVYLAFHKSLLPFWLAHINDQDQAELAKNADSFNFFDEDGEWCTIIFEDVKWYGSHSEIKAVEKTFEYFEEHHGEELFQYLRVGEEWDDVEHLGYADKFRIYRRVNVL